MWCCSCCVFVCVTCFSSYLAVQPTPILGPSRPRPTRSWCCSCCMFVCVTCFSSIPYNATYPNLGPVSAAADAFLVLFLLCVMCVTCFSPMPCSATYPNLGPVGLIPHYVPPSAYSTCRYPPANMRPMHTLQCDIPESWARLERGRRVLGVVLVVCLCV